MEFNIALTNVLITLMYIVPGYIAAKSKKALADHLSTMSAVLIYICAPCMVVSSFMSLDYSAEDIKNMGLFFAATFILQALFMLIMSLVLGKRKNDSKYRILTIASVLGNVGFFGLPIVKALLPNNPEVVCYSSIYTISMNMLVFTVGIYCLTGKKEYMSVKSAILNPSVISFAVALPLYVLGARKYTPDVLMNSIQLLGNMTTPLCMIILGIRLSTVPFKQLIFNSFVYLICFGKLILFPLFCFGMVYFLPLALSFKASILILSSVPCASVILNLAEIHHSQTELSANCVLVSTILCFITIPILTLLL